MSFAASIGLAIQQLLGGDSQHSAGLMHFMPLCVALQREALGIQNSTVAHHIILQPAFLRVQAAPGPSSPVYICK